METLAKLLGGTIMACIVVIYFSFSGGFVLSTFWNWFVASVFTGLPRLTWLQGTGLLMIIGLIKPHEKTYTYKGEEIKSKHSINPWLYPWFSLLIGWFVHIVIITFH